jgi:hypothetical protein
VESLQSYWLYFLDASGFIARVKPLSCPDDSHAIQAANADRDAPMELWTHRRLVEAFPARPPG